MIRTSAWNAICVVRVVRWQSVIVAAVLCLRSSVAAGQEPIDLFADVAALGQGNVRIGAWNLRHINVEGGADEFLPGDTEEEDFAILICPGYFACPAPGEPAHRARFRLRSGWRRGV